LANQVPISQRYNPELQKRSLEERERRQQEFDDYVNKLKEWSKSDKSSMFNPDPLIYLRPSWLCYEHAEK